MNEPIVLFTEIVGPVGHYAGHVVVGQDRDVIHDTPKPGVWLSFGDTCWFLSEAGTLKLRDFCNAALGESKYDGVDGLAKAVLERANEERNSQGAGPAFDAKAPNPGGLAAAPTFLGSFGATQP